MAATQLKRGLGTLALHAGQEPDPATTARAVPIYATTIRAVTTPKVELQE
jgi:O-acetylhomoserine/O-acetylserine sulfhydrylase-like pyridoxal-dependent enzyme